ncbi:MAG: winged helix-turn-helix domain-containing protein [Myxococcota bacterium]|nr:winged helix-turn-helix domain-containing protein [Myxococcota bacterium]
MAAVRSNRQRRKTSARGPGGDKRDGEARWTFLSNHSHVLICLHREPELTLREVADRVGITERSVQRIVRELEEGGFVRRERQGLRNRYRFKTNARLRHPIESHRTIGDLIDMVES